MIAVLLEFSDDPARLDLRATHRAMLAELHEQGVAVMCGPWADESGALLVFDADETTVREILDRDPYYSAPGVGVLSIREWNVVIGTR